MLEERFQKALEREVVYEEIPSLNPSDSENIKAIVFDGSLRHGMMTQVFAYYGVPEGAAEGELLPAILLIHGGGGHAFANWVQMWNRRGYVAIAVDTVGGFPNDNKSGCCGNQKEWLYELPECITHRGGCLAPMNDEMGNCEGQLEDQWMYHAVHSAILAHNILKQDERVDSSKIGVTGISWGGVITSLLMGYDLDFLFAIPIYGSGFMRDGYAPVEKMFHKPKAEELWLAEERFSKVKSSVLWVASNDDHCFSVVPVSKSYESISTHEREAIGVKKDSRISLIHNLLHSHEDGWAPKEIGRYADAMIGRCPMLPWINTAVSGDKLEISVQVLGENQGEVIRSITLFYLIEEIEYVKMDKFRRGIENSYYRKEPWKTIDIKEHLEVGIPIDARGYYIEVITELEGIEYTVTTGFTEVEETKF